MDKADSTKTNNKKRSTVKKKASICLHNSSPVVRRVAKSLGMNELTFSSPWDLCWSNGSMDIRKSKNLKKYQITNHFSGMSEICRKDLLSRNLNTMANHFQNDYNFFPKTWYLPSDYSKLQVYTSIHKTSTYILKPTTGSRGTGIYLTKSLKKINQYEKMICQIYITKSLLINGYKFDIRVYTLIASCDPLRIYVYNDGLVRLATEPYKKPSNQNMDNSFMHLTNYSVNKHSNAYVDNEVNGSKRRIATLNDWLRKNGHDVKKIWAEIDDAIIKTVILAYPSVNHSYQTCFSGHVFRSACFEILGFDILLDEKCKPHLLEVNHSPDLHTDTELDKTVKQQLLMDTFRLLQLDKTFKSVALAEEKWKTAHHALNCDKTVYKQRILECRQKFDKQNLEWEINNMGNYRLVFSENNASLYEHFFYRNENLQYQKPQNLLLLKCKPEEKQQLDVKLTKSKTPKADSSTRSEPIKRNDYSKNHRKSRLAMKTNSFTRTAILYKTRSVVNKKTELKTPVKPRLKISCLSLGNVRNNTFTIKSKNIIGKKYRKSSNRQQIKSSKQPLRQTAGCSNSLECIETIKKKNKSIFPDVQSCLFSKHFTKKKSFLDGWESDCIGQKEENVRMDLMLDRGDLVFKLVIKEHIYRAFEKMNNLHVEDQTDYAKYRKKCEHLGITPKTYNISCESDDQQNMSTNRGRRRT